MSDDYRIRIEVADEHAGGLLERLGFDLGGEAAELARDLEARRLVVSRDDNELFVYAGSREAAERAGEIVDAELRDLEHPATRGPVEHWLADEGRWDDEPPGETWEEDERARGYAPWEVRVACDSHEEARALADELEGEGLAVERRWRYLVVGAGSREEADELAARIHGQVEPGGQAVWETVPGNPFAVFGGLAG